MGMNFSHENVPEVKEHLKTMAEKVRNQIRKELNGRFLCVMIDLCSKIHRKSKFIKNDSINIIYCIEFPYYCL